jgi:quinol monooxygenase YgiN
MIFVAGTLTMNPAIVAEFQRDVAEMRPKVLEERGCHHYSLLVEDEAAGVANVLEMWADDDALVEHLKQPWTADFYGKYVGHMRDMAVQVYDIAGPPRPIPAT